MPDTYCPGFSVVVLAAAIYIGKSCLQAALFLRRAWRDAEQRRDVAFANRPYGGLGLNEPKPSALPYLFK